MDVCQAWEFGDANNGPDEGEGGGGSAPALGAVFRVPAENPSAPEIFERSGPSHAPGAGREGASSYARGGRAPPTSEFGLNRKDLNECQAVVEGGREAEFIPALPPEGKDIAVRDSGQVVIIAALGQDGEGDGSVVVVPEVICLNDGLQ